MSLLRRLFNRARERQADPQWQLSYIQEICIAMLQQVPDDWKSAYLILEPTEKGIGAGMAHSAITRTRSADFALRDGEFVTPGPEVLAATRRLELAWIAHKETFKRAIISAVFKDEQWEIRSDYEHDD